VPVNLREMKKGTVNTCNGCLAFEHSVWTCPIGSPAGRTLSKERCGLGYEIEKNGSGFKPKMGQCPKPKTLSSLSNEMKIFFEKCRLEMESSHDR